MTDPTPLSPQAQALMDATFDYWPGGHNHPHKRVCIAAALRAAADQVVPEENSMPVNLAHRVWWDSRQSVRFQLLALAAELEGADG